ncbi:MAG: tetratricopeptide repeat protein [Gallionellaceae bacterium]
MSLINQVLNDLEKRGASVPSIEESIRPVPVEKKYFHPYLAIALLLLASLAAGAWVAQRMAAKSPLPVAPSAVENSLLLSQVLVKPEEEMPLPQPNAVEEKAKSGAIASRLSSELSRNPKVNSVGEAPRSEIRADKTSVQSAPDKKTDGATRGAPSTPIGKQVIKMTMRQQAENEFHKATLLVQQGQLRDAISGYEAALLIDPMYDKAREGLVAVLLTNKSNAEAEKVLQEGLSLNEKQTRFAMLLARLQIERRALSLALQTLEKTLPFAASQPDYQAFMAALLQRQDRHAEAISHYQTALQLSPNSGVWLMGLGISLQAMKRNDEAKDSYKRAVETHGLSPALQAFVEQRLADLK